MHVGGILVKIRPICQVIVVAAEALRQFHPAATCEVKGVVTHTQYLNFLHQVVAQSIIQMCISGVRTKQSINLSSGGVAT